MRHEHSVDVAPSKQETKICVLRRAIDHHSGLGLEFHFLIGGQKPFDPLPFDTILEFEIALGEQRKRRLKRGKTNATTNEIAGMLMSLSARTNMQL